MVLISEARIRRALQFARPKVYTVVRMGAMYRLQQVLDLQVHHARYP